MEDLSPLAHPLAQKKLLKKLHKTIKKGANSLFAHWSVRLNAQRLYTQISSLKNTTNKARRKRSGERRTEGGERVCHFVPFYIIRVINARASDSLLVLAADINPIDIISHLPVLAEEAQVPYIFVASKEELGHASSTKRPTSCVMICPEQKRRGKKKDGEGEGDKGDDWKELYDECYREIEKMDERVVF